MVKREVIIREALDKKQAALRKKEAERENRLRKAHEDLPRLGEAERELALKGTELATAALSGNAERLAQLREEMTPLQQEVQQLLARAQVGETEYDCPLCRDTGYVQGRLCECVRQEVKRMTVEQLSSEMPLDNCRFDNFSLEYYPEDGADGKVRRYMSETLRLCREYVDGFTPHGAKNLLFMGGPGLGKTHLTLSVVNGLIDRGFDVVYGSAYNLISAVERENFSSEKGDSYEVMLECDLLVLDDLGTEFISPFAQTVLYGLINSRILSRRPTVINTNLTMPEIEKRYTQRIASRLMGEYTVRLFRGKDIRQIKAGY